jgi:hypothetical protein
MAVVTAQVTCPISVYTAISSAGQTNVSFAINNGALCRMIIATSAPAVTDTNFVHLSREGNWHTLSSLGASDIVYIRPSVDGVVLDVVKG